MKLKGKSKFTTLEISELKRLITLRIVSTRNKQKSIRQTMRNIGFYGRDDWGINNCQVEDLENLIYGGGIQIIK